MNKFKNYNISSEEKKEVKKYLQKIKDFVEKNNLDNELYQDIEERFFEKLSNLKQINKVEIKKIIAEIGEPEDIFEVEEVENKEEKIEYTFFQKYYLDLILFWLLPIFIAILGESSLIFAIIIFLFIFLFLPYLFFDNKNKSVFNFFKFIISSVKKTFIIIWKFIKLIFKNIFPIFRFMFFSSMGIVFSTLLLGLLFLYGAYFTNFSYKNIEIFSNFPVYFAYGTIFGIFSLTIFSIYSFSYAFRKKGFGNLLIILASFSLFISIFFAGATAFDLFKKYNYSENLEKIYEFILKDKNIKNLDIITDLYSKDFLGINRYNIDLKVSKDDKIRVVEKFRIWGVKEQMKEIKNSFNPIIGEFRDNSLNFNYKNDELFSKKLPFFLTDSIKKEIYIPKNIVFTNSDGFFTPRINLPKKYEKYEPFLRIESCEKYFYDENINDFTCEINKKALEKAKLEIKKFELIKIISSLSPIKHKLEYKRNYYSDICRGYKIYDNCRLDWQVSDGDMDISENKIEFIYRDRSITIKAKVDYKEENDKIEFSNFEILDMKVDTDIFNLKYYEEKGLITLLKDFELEIFNKLQEKNLIKKLGELSPIKHQEQYKKRYFFENKYSSSEKHFIYTDWQVDENSIKFDNSSVKINYADNSLKISAKVKFREKQDGNLEFYDFKIEKIKVNYDIFQNYYYTKESLVYIFEKTKKED